MPNIQSRVAEALPLKIADILPEHYGCVILTATGSVLLNMWLAINVGRARKKHNIEYPTMYSLDNKMFNCIQRAHQHTLEGYPSFLFFLLVGGLQYPRISAGAGLAYLLSRVAYALGYYTGEPKKRAWGAWGHVAELILLGNTVSFACHQLKWVGKH